MSMPGAPTVPCKYCKRAIDSDATKCPECQSDLRRKSWFNLEGWSKLIGFLIALTTVVSLGSDKLSALYLVLTGQDGAVINLEFTDARFSEAKADGEPAELKSAVGTVSNSGRGQGVLFAQVVCLGEDLAAGDAGKREVLVWAFRADAPALIDAGKLSSVEFQFNGLSPYVYPSRESALANWRWKKSSPLFPKYTCKFNYDDKNGSGHRGFTGQQPLLSALEPKPAK